MQKYSMKIKEGHMPGNIEQLQSMFKTLKMPYAAASLDEIIKRGIDNNLTREKFLEEILLLEIADKEKRKIEKRMKIAGFPEYRTISDFNVNEQRALSQKQINQLKELTWLGQGYNIVLLGPTGAGKTLLSVGIGVEAVNSGYNVIFTTMADLVHMLKTQEISSTTRNRIKRITDSDLLIIDDLMFMAMEKQEANLFFQLINRLYGKTSIIITSNKGPEEWGELLGDAAITTAILDRIVHKCEIVNFQDNDSYRLKHRTTIFKNS